MVRIIGGPTALIDTLAGRVGDANIRTSAPVTELSEDGQKRVSVHIGAAGKDRASGRDGCLIAFRYPVPGQQFVDPVDFVILETGEDIGEVSFGIP